jgi:hypothetical protein
MPPRVCVIKKGKKRFYGKILGLFRFLKLIAIFFQKYPNILLGSYF